MNTRISFNIAKLLKQKGFDKIMKYHYPNLNVEKQETCLPTNWNNFTDMSGNSDYYSAPIISDVVMWLYKKHGIWISVIQNEYEDMFQYTLTQRKPYSWNIVDNGKLFNSPIKAYEAAIEYTLKIIKNENNN